MADYNQFPHMKNLVLKRKRRNSIFTTKALGLLQKKKKCLVVRDLPNNISAFADCLFYLIAMNSPPNTLLGTPCQIELFSTGMVVLIRYSETLLRDNSDRRGDKSMYTQTTFTRSLTFYKLLVNESLTFRTSYFPRKAYDINSAMFHRNWTVTP